MTATTVDTTTNLPGTGTMVAFHLDPDTTVHLTPGEIAAALHLSGARLSPTMLPRLARLTDLVRTGLSRAGLPAVTELAVTTAELDERIDRGEATRAEQARLRRLWRSAARDDACTMFANALAGFGPMAGWLR